MDQNECPNCGAMFDKNEKCCKYCGTANPNYVEPVKKNDYYSNNSFMGSASTVYTTNTQPKSGVNWIIFILLFILFWPLAIVYLIVKAIAKK